MTDLVLAKGEGSYISSECGRRMLDFTSGIGGTLHTAHSCSSGASLPINLTDPRASLLSRPRSTSRPPFAVTNLGHCHPKVTKAAQDQCATLVHGQVNIGFNKPYLKLIEKLLPVMPHKSLDTFFFWNSGAEAVEASIKLARMATGKDNISKLVHAQAPLWMRR